MPDVILVNDLDEQTGICEKLEAHRKGLLHRAFSVFIFNSENKILMQQRAAHKYHSPNLWTNTCCSHPYPNEKTLNAAKRRLMQEMGISAELKFVFKFKYKAKFDNNLFEHEIDHVFVGYSDNLPVINPEEVQNYKYSTIEELNDEIQKYPEKFTVWFKIIFQKFKENDLKKFIEQS